MIIGRPEDFDAVDNEVTREVHRHRLRRVTDYLGVGLEGFLMLAKNSPGKLTDRLLQMTVYLRNEEKLSGNRIKALRSACRTFLDFAGFGHKVNLSELKFASPLRVGWPLIAL